MSAPRRRPSGVRSAARPGERGGIFSKLLSLIFVVALLGGIYLFRHPLLRAAGGFWVVSDAPEPADAILILGDDDYEADRVARAAELYQGRWAPLVVGSGRYLRPYASVAQFMQRDLTERGVPSSAVVVFAHNAANTREEALALRRLAVERHWRHVLVVTSNYHTRRTRYIFRRVWPPAFEFRVIAANDLHYDPDHWWESRGSLKTFFYESLGLCVAAWELSGSS
jgi:uncharacterized SAM-binding protein YcdF (DUF218 family)